MTGKSGREGVPVRPAGELASPMTGKSGREGVPVRPAGELASPMTGKSGREGVPVRPAGELASPMTGKSGERARRARRGSEFLFRTTLLAYTVGVLAAEDAAIAGSAREALARVIAHNAGDRTRHAGRPPCDTTHCQAFLGTQRARPGDPELLEREPLPYPGWLPFSQGGDEPWTERRPAASVDALLGGPAASLSFSAGRLRYLRLDGSADAPYDEPLTLGCERLRGPLKLPSCPDSAQRDAGSWLFRGHGRGHGEGLDVERAKKTSAGADALLEAAFAPRGE
jgi:hypothetical protein